MITQMQYISKDIRIEVNENSEISIIKGNQEITFTQKEIILLAECELEMIVDYLAYNIQVIKEVTGKNED